jgi:hypothetical protein
LDEIDMIKKMIVLIGAVACTGLVVIFVPGFAREIGAGVMLLSKIELGVEDAGLVISPPDAGCPHDPWPYGCDWRAPIGQKQIVKSVRTRHHRYALTTVR